MNWRNPGRWRDGVVGTALVLGVAACTWQGLKPDDSSTGHLYISGETAHVDDARLAAIAAPYLEASFFDVDIEGLQAELSRQPWLTEVSVSRHWPDGVAVHIAEHQPVALWGDAGVLAADGHVFRPHPETRPSDLVQLDGPDSAGRQVYEQYQKLSDMVAGEGVRIAALRKDARGSWTAVLDNGLVLRLGRDAVAERMHRFVDYALARSQAREALATAGYVDLRYSDGFAVGGKRADQTTGQEQEKVNEQAA